MTATATTATKRARLSKAQRGYQLISAASAKLKFLPEEVLTQIAKAINPAAEPSYLILESREWRDGDTQLNAGVAGSDYQRMRPALVFTREQRPSTALLRYDVRLVMSFHRAETDSRTVWIDCETGLPWIPPATLRLRSLTAPERQAEANAFFVEATNKAQRVLGAGARPRGGSVCH